MPIRTGIKKILEVLECRREEKDKYQKVISQRKVMIFHTMSPTIALERAASLPGSESAPG